MLYRGTIATQCTAGNDERGEGSLLLRDHDRVPDAGPEPSRQGEAAIDGKRHARLKYRPVTGLELGAFEILKLKAMIEAFIAKVSASEGDEDKS